MRRVADVPRIQRLPADAHKGIRGRVLVVAGSLHMSGAARLCGWGALRGGAGLVTIATPDVVQLTVAGELPTALTLPLPSRRGALAVAGVAEARNAAEGVDALAVGPGLTRDVTSFLRRFFRGLQKPLVLDADGLNVLSENPDLLKEFAGPKVLTPHPGEASRLLQRKVEGGREARLQAAAELAEKFDAVAVLKGAGTVVCDGERAYVNRSGNPGMATGGTGDVLTGLLAARLAQGAAPFDAAVQAVFAHGRAGDLAAASTGESMIATDLVASLPAAMEEIRELPSRSRKEAARRSSARRSRRER